MLKYSKAELNRQAKELGFVRDTFEKICRLTDVLTFMDSDPLQAESLALKGGTAINLTIFKACRFLTGSLHGFFIPVYCKLIFTF